MVFLNADETPKKGTFDIMNVHEDRKASQQYKGALNVCRK